MSERKRISTIGLTGLLGDVRRQNNFVLTIEEITENTNLDLIVQQAFLPKVSIAPIELRHGNEAIKLAGAVSWEGGTITILDVISNKELEAINNWFDLIYNYETGQIGFADKYKKTGYITEYAADGQYKRKWELIGMWISDLDPGQLNATSAEGKEISFTIQIDPSPTRPVEYGDEYKTANNEKRELELNRR